MLFIELLLTTIAFLGDSNLWLGGEDCSKETSWSYWMVESVRQASSHESDEVIARSFARSGATLTNVTSTPSDTTLYSELLDDANTLYNQVLRLNGAVERCEIPSPDIIILYGGTNDAWFADRRPGLFDNISADRGEKPELARHPGQATTLRESLALLVRLLESDNPESRIIMVGPPLTTKVSDGQIKRVTDIMEEIARREGLQMIRLDSPDLIDPKVEARNFTLTRDGVHTSVSGAHRIGQYVYKQLPKQLNNQKIIQLKNE